MGFYDTYLSYILNAYTIYLVAVCLHFNLSFFSSLGKRLAVHLEAEEVVNLNITSTLIELYSKVKADWTVGSGSLDNRVSAGGRIPFVPFVLRNETGVDLWFCTHTKSSVGMNFVPNASSSTLAGEYFDFTIFFFLNL